MTATAKTGKISSSSIFVVICLLIHIVYWYGFPSLGNWWYAFGLVVAGIIILAGLWTLLVFRLLDFSGFLLFLLAFSFLVGSAFAGYTFQIHYNVQYAGIIGFLPANLILGYYALKNIPLKKPSKYKVAQMLIVLIIFSLLIILPFFTWNMEQHISTNYTKDIINTTVPKYGLVVISFTPPETPHMGFTEEDIMGFEVRVENQSVLEKSERILMLKSVHMVPFNNFPKEKNNCTIYTNIEGFGSSSLREDVGTHHYDIYIYSISPKGLYILGSCAILLLWLIFLTPYGKWSESWQEEKRHRRIQLENLAREISTAEQKATSAILSAESKLREAEKLGVHDAMDAKVKKLLDEAVEITKKKAADVGALRLAHMSAVEAENIIEKKIYQHREISAKISKLKKLIKEAEDRGIPADEEKKLVRELEEKMAQSRRKRM